MPSGPGVIPEDTIARIARLVPPGVTSFLLTCCQDAAAIVEQQRRLGASALQLCDRVAPGAHREIRDALPGIRIVQVVHVSGAESVDEAMAVAPDVDAILLDSGNPSLAIKELGGTGRRHDWAHSRRIRESVAVPVFLAGGLTPANAVEAVREVGPYGLDVCSGVRTDGALDPEKLSRFLGAAAGA
jgi:phosphoribosylanthranilate isomerase